MNKDKLFHQKLAVIYDLYLAKAKRKGRTEQEVQTILCWLCGYEQTQLQALLQSDADFISLFTDAPCMQPKRLQIKGAICGVRIEEIEDPLMRDIRCLDKLIDELAKGKPLDKILRS